MTTKPYIPIADLLPGSRYKGEGRNFNEAVWNGEHFVGQREKFGSVFEDTELHYDADLRYGTFKPFECMDGPEIWELDEKAHAWRDANGDVRAHADVEVMLNIYGVVNFAMMVEQERVSL